MSFKLPMPKPGGGFDCRHTVSGAVAEALLPAFKRGSAPYAPPHAAYDARRGLARDQLPLLAGLAAAGIGSAVGTATHALMSGPGPATTDQRRRTTMATQYRRARDQSPDDDEGLNQVKVFLKNRLDPADYSRLEQMLQALSGGESEREDPPPDDTGSMHYQNGGGAGDEPEPGESLLPNGGAYRNIPAENRREVGKDRRFAQDSRSGGGYFANFPSNAKVTFGYGS
jgi:hypothetical protein